MALARLALGAGWLLAPVASLALPVVDGPPADPVPQAHAVGVRALDSSVGLPQLSVFSLAADASGWIYAGSQDGLARWDGRRFAAIPLVDDVHDWVTHLHVAGDRLWIGTQTRGLQVLADGRVSEVRMTDGARMPSIEAFADAGAGNLWVGTPVGVFRCGSSCARLPGTEDLQVAELLPLADGTLWVGTNLDGLHRFRVDANGGLARDGLHWGRSDGLPNDAIRALHQDRLGRLWIGTGRGLARWDGHTLTRWMDSGRGPLGGVFALRELADGTLLAATWGAGLARFRMRDDGYRLDGLAEGLPDRYLMSLLVTGDDDDPIVWLGAASGGVLRLEEGRWEAFDERAGLPQRAVVGVGEVRFEDDAGTLWAGTLGGAVRWQDGAFVPLMPPDFRRRVLYAIVRDPRGRTWYATEGGMLREQAGAWRVYDADGDGLPATSVEHLLWFDNRLWVGTGHGLAAIVDDEVVLPFAQDARYAGIAVHALTLGPDPRRMLVGTSEGLLVSDGRTLAPAAPGCDSHGNVYDVEVLADGQVWLGTRAGALRLRLDAPAPRCAPLAVAAFGDRAVYEVLQDRAGQVYLFGYDGVRRVPASGEAGEVLHYGQADGLPSLEFNREATLDRHGRIWAANAAGLVRFDPAAPSRAPRNAPLLLQAETGGAPLPPGARLPASPGELVFRPRLLSFRHEHRIQYRTQLVGLESAPGPWQADGDRRYPRIPPGDYRFRVEARDAAGQMHGPVEHGFSVAAPWWQHPLALLAAALVLSGGGLLIGRLRARALTARAAHLEALVAERTQALAHASNTDPLTGACNRRWFNEHARRDLASSERGAWLALVDIDHFKQINDRYGHSVGDEVLVAVAGRLRTLAGGRVHVVRWGGEEFLLLLPGHADDPAPLAPALAVVADAPIASASGALGVSCSIGYTWCDSTERAVAGFPDAAIARADAALYRAKHAGRNRALAAETGAAP